MGDVSLSGSDIRAYLSEVAEALPPGRQHTVIMVGESLLAWHGLRESTKDVDSVRLLDEALRDAAAEVAHRHGLDPRWLNDRARPFEPQTLRDRDCDVLLDHARLLVLGAPLDQLFLMKLDASRVRSSDYEDMVALWPRCDFASAEHVVDLYHQAYPLAVDDEFLVDYVAGIAAAGSSGER